MKKLRTKVIFMKKVHICLSCMRVAEVERQEEVKVGGVGHTGTIMVAVGWVFNIR